MKKAMTVALGAICSTGVMGEVLSTQDLSLKPGWNAVYAEVSPTGTLDSVFESWPTDSVGLYDPGAFLSTAQFAAEGETQGMTAPPFATWKRGYPEASDAKRLPAGTVLLYFGTNASRVVTALVGVPAAPRLKWHVSGTNDVYNYVGFSLARGAGVTTAPSDYLDGFGGAYLSNRTFYRIFGTSKAEAPRMIKVTSAKVADGDVLIMPSDIVSDWSGVLWVSPRSGLDYGRDDVKRTLTIRNDGTKPRTVSIDLVDDAANRQDITLAYTWLHVRDAGAALTNAQWTACTDAHVAAKTLAAGETWNLQVGLDRKAMNGYPAGKSFGLILRITETEGYSKMRVDVPIQGETSGGAASARAWPGGLWVGAVAAFAGRTVLAATAATIAIAAMTFFIFIFPFLERPRRRRPPARSCASAPSACPPRRRSSRRRKAISRAARPRSSLPWPAMARRAFCAIPTTRSTTA